MIYLIAYTTILSVKGEVYSLNLLFTHTLLPGSIAYSVIIIKGRYMGLSLKM